MEKWQREKSTLLEQSNNYLMCLANNNEPPLLIEAIQNIRDRAATANKKEWKDGEYWNWWKSIRPVIYA